MSQHDDLFEAAIKAIDAVSAKRSGDKQPPEDDLDDALQNIDIGNIFEPDENDGAQEEPDEDLNLEFSISAFQAADRASGGSEDTNGMTSPASSSLKSGEGAGQSADYLSFVSKIDKLQGTLEAKTLELTQAVQHLNAANEENARLAASEKQLSDRIVRLSADFDNYRKRVARDQELQKHQIEERIVVSFLSVMDNFERAIAHAKQSSDYEQLLRGVELTSRMYLSTLAKHGCVPFDSLGMTFDPVYHDVLQRVIDPEKEDNVIVQEHLKGYMMHDRVVRPALVVVSQQCDETEMGGDKEKGVEEGESCQG